MQSCECCCQYDYEASMTRMGDHNPKKNENSTFHDRPQSSDKVIINENRKPPNLFSIDAILSRPQKLENRKRPMESTSPSFHRAKHSISPVSYGHCCSSPKSHFSECRSPRCPSPSQASPLQRQDYVTYYRRADLLRPLKEFHFDRRMHNEPTMVAIDKQSFSPACVNCQDCKLAELRRFRFGTPSIIPCSNDTVMPSNRLDQDRDAKRNKRKRTIFTTEQLDRLEHEFQHQQYVVGQERKYLAVELGLNEIQVKVWFQNRRIKWRKQKGSRIQPVTVDMENF